MRSTLTDQAIKRQAATRGVSLIEALVALAVLSFGMLAVVGVQAMSQPRGGMPG